MLGDFHILLAEVAGNSLLIEMPLRELSARSAIITVLYQSDGGCRVLFGRASRFPGGGAQEDAESACRLMVEHLDHVEQELDFEANTQGDSDLVAALLTLSADKHPHRPRAKSRTIAAPSIGPTHRGCPTCGKTI